VVFLLYPKQGEWHFLLLKRHDYKGVHSGQVGFPGGSLDEGEHAIQAAIRELKEESGLEIISSDIIKELTSLYIPPSNFVVQPFAAIVDSEPIWKFDTHEVKRGIEVSLEDLLKKESLSDSCVKMSGGNTRLNVKAFTFENETVWGATAMILSECKEILRTLAP
jgi:8-oxo-dGTP pyrophosphatase MutT (NUDIX family)